MLEDNISPAHNRTLVKIILHSTSTKLLEKSFILHWTNFIPKDLNSSSMNKLTKEYNGMLFVRIS